MCDVLASYRLGLLLLAFIFTFYLLNMERENEGVSNNEARYITKHKQNEE